MKIINILLLSLFILVSCSSAGSDEISGELEAGLRVLQVDSGKDDLNFTIYRGDYIVFDFEKTGTYDFKVPGLEIDTKMPVSGSDTPYVKMKKSGNYSFTLGVRKGTFHVLELVAKNYSEVSAAEALELIDNVNPVIIDVRTQAEYNSGHLPDAELLPVQVFAENLANLEKYKDEDILLYCASGNRSTVAARILIDAGFSRVYNLRYGFGDWSRKGQPVE